MEHLNPRQVSPEVQNGDISGPTRRTDDLQQFFFKFPFNYFQRCFEVYEIAVSFARG